MAQIALHDNRTRNIVIGVVVAIVVVVGIAWFMGAFDAASVPAVPATN